MPVPSLSFFKSSTLRASSATRAVWSFFSVSFETLLASAPAFRPPCDKVSRSGLAAAAAFLSSTWACTLPLACRAGSLVLTAGTPLARRSRYAPKSALWAWITCLASAAAMSFAEAADGTVRTEPAFRRFMLLSMKA